jgi:hypothetical protein
LRTIYTPVAGRRNDYFWVSREEREGGEAKIGHCHSFARFAVFARDSPDFPARIGKWPHRWENRRTDGKMARTEREIARTD